MFIQKTRTLIIKKHAIYQFLKLSQNGKIEKIEIVRKGSNTGEYSFSGGMNKNKFLNPNKIFFQNSLMVSRSFGENDRFARKDGDFGTGIWLMKFPKFQKIFSFWILGILQIGHVKIVNDFGSMKEISFVKGFYDSEVRKKLFLMDVRNRRILKVLRIPGCLSRNPNLISFSLMENCLVFQNFNEKNFLKFVELNGYFDEACGVLVKGVRHPELIEVMDGFLNVFSGGGESGLSCYRIDLRKGNKFEVFEASEEMVEYAKDEYIGIFNPNQIVAKRVNTLAIKEKFPEIGTVEQHRISLDLDSKMGAPKLFPMFNNHLLLYNSKNSTFDILTHQKSKNTLKIKKTLKSQLLNNPSAAKYSILQKSSKDQKASTFGLLTSFARNLNSQNSEFIISIINEKIEIAKETKILLRHPKKFSQIGFTIFNQTFAFAYEEEQANRFKIEVYNFEGQVMYFAYTDPSDFPGHYISSFGVKWSTLCFENFKGFSVFVKGKHNLFRFGAKGDDENLMKVEEEVVLSDDSFAKGEMFRGEENYYYLMWKNYKVNLKIVGGGKIVKEIEFEEDCEINYMKEREWRLIELRPGKVYLKNLAARMEFYVIDVDSGEVKRYRGSRLFMFMFLGKFEDGLLIKKGEELSMIEFN